MAADRKIIIKARENLDTEFNKPLSLNRLARKAGMSPAKLSEQETQIFTPFEFLIKLRAEEAIELLLKATTHIRDSLRMRLCNH